VEWLFADTLPTTGVVILSGQSGGGKTFVGLYLARSVATGEAWFGIKPNLTGGTLILVGEAFGSLKLRMSSLPGGLPIAATYVGGLAARGAWPQLCSDIRDAAAQMELIHGQPVRLIVLDTLSSSGLIENENDNAEVAKVMKQLAELSSALGALLVVVHHPPKNGIGERGAGAIRNNADYVLTINRNGNEPLREIEITKSRDAECRALGTFTLVPVTTKSGSTMVVSPGEPRIKRSASTAKAQRFQRIFDEVYGNDPQPIEARRTVRIDALRTAIASRTERPDKSNIARMIREARQFGRFEEIETSGVRYLAECLPLDPPSCLGGHP
jgi:hypothetical protein